jgi:hypothetical protein
MKLTRKRLLGGAAAAAALGAAAVYELVDQVADKPIRPRLRTVRPVEQHLLDGVDVILDDGIKVVVPPLHHRVLTARLKTGERRAALRAARDELEQVLARLDADYPSSPAGLTVTVGWGLPYFRRYVPGQARLAIPVDLRATQTRGRKIRVLDDAELFPSDPEATILEDNDVAFLLRSDHLAVIDDAQRRLVDGFPDIFDLMSVRKGFVGGGFRGSASLPKRMAVAAGITGAELIPRTAELFLGFTSTQKQALGPRKIANIEALGYADMGDGYFAGGTHMHLSHLHENLNAWYLNFDHQERVDAMFRPGLRVRRGQQTVRQSARDVESVEELTADYVRRRSIGHAGSLQSASRLDRDTIAVDGTLYPKGTAVPIRADFNTVDNPFAWSSHPVRDRMTDEPDTGLHFVVFNPTSDDFRRVRLAMDGILPDGTHLDFAPRSRGQGFNSVLRTTHRQNFLVPPRAHRSFPLTEFR